LKEEWVGGYIGLFAGISPYGFNTPYGVFRPIL